jgi:flagella basal body P-ring formation protein FlgA
MNKLPKYIFLISLIVATRGNANCTLLLSSKILSGFSSGNSNSYIKNTNCPSSIITALDNFVTSNTGIFSAQSLSRNIALLTNTENINIGPDKITISKISDELRIHLKLANSSIINQISISENLSSIGIENFSFDTPEKIDSGHIRMNIDNNRSSWIRFQILNKHPTVTAIRSISNGESLVINENVILKEEYTNNNGVYLTQLEPYMVAVKNINKGDMLRHEHYRRNTIVNARSPVGVILKTGEIKISTSGTSLSAGQYGQTIQVRLENTKKVVNANVIAPNKVMVEL